MRMRRTDDPTTFLAACAEVIAADAVEHNVAGTVAHGEAARGVRRSTYLWSGQPGPAAVCLCTPGEPFLLSGAGPEQAEAFADALVDDPEPGRPGGVAVGVRGPVAAARAFAARWQARTGQQVDREMAQGVHVCDRLVPPAQVPGTARLAVPEDVSTALDRLGAFAEEAGVGRPLRDRVEAMVAGQRLWWWVDADRSRHPVAMAAVTPAPVGVARIGAVHTPPEHRRRGYASVLTAHLTARVLVAGGRAMLFTDLANPTSNGIYAAIGYRRVGDVLALWFLQADGQGPQSPTG